MERSELKEQMEYLVNEALVEALAAKITDGTLELWSTVHAEMRELKDTVKQLRESYDARKASDEALRKAVKTIVIELQGELGKREASRDKLNATLDKMLEYFEKWR